MQVRKSGSTFHLSPLSSVIFIIYPNYPSRPLIYFYPKFLTLFVFILIYLFFFVTAAKLIGEPLYKKVSSVALALYSAASTYAESRGLILADTKFEFGLLPTPNSPPSEAAEQQLILIDELLTPDSSRYWPKDGYKPGGPQPSFDKQYLRDWLVKAGFKKGLEGGPEGHEGEGWVIEESVVEGTRERYKEAVDKLMGGEK